MAKPGSTIKYPCQRALKIQQFGFYISQDEKLSSHHVLCPFLWSSV